MNDKTRCGYIAIVGRPNVGKSTLLNCILGQKISITSPKPQTTRSQILGIKSNEQDQAIYIDTPGMHEIEKFAMNRFMNKLATSVIADADVVVFMVEADHWNKEDELVLTHLKEAKAPVILAINKIDELKPKSLLLPLINKLQNKFDFADIIPLSASYADNVSALEAKIAEYLPEGPHLYPDEQVTDKNLRFQISELIREKLIHATEQEVPYSTTVEIENYEEKDKLVEISAIIWVERDGQKPIVIGKNGERLKLIGTKARKDIERLLNQKVFLRLWVKVKDKWTDDERALKSLGFE
ncbi:MAG: GTPase Era [Gammaproteobacteria bacterium]|nr:GTPase Era [Gammaproteobacteria bacterium]